MQAMYVNFPPWRQTKWINSIATYLLCMFALTALIMPSTICRNPSNKLSWNFSFESPRKIARRRVTDLSLDSQLCSVSLSRYTASMEAKSASSSLALWNYKWTLYIRWISQCGSLKGGGVEKCHWILEPRSPIILHKARPWEWWKWFTCTGSISGSPLSLSVINVNDG